MGYDLFDDHFTKPSTRFFNPRGTHGRFIKIRPKFSNDGNSRAIGDQGDPNRQADLTIWCCTTLVQWEIKLNKVMRTTPKTLSIWARE